MVKKITKKKVLAVVIIGLIIIGYATNKAEVAEGEPFRQQLISAKAGFPPETTVDKQFVRWPCAADDRPSRCGTKRTGYAEQRVLRATVVIMGCTVYIDRLPGSETDYVFREIRDTDRQRIEVATASPSFTRRNPTHAHVQAYLIFAKKALKLDCLIQK